MILPLSSLTCICLLGRQPEKGLHAFNLFFPPALYFSFYFSSSPRLPPVVESRGKHPGQILALCYGNRGRHPADAARWSEKAVEQARRRRGELLFGTCRGWSTLVKQQLELLERSAGY